MTLTSQFSGLQKKKDRQDNVTSLIPGIHDVILNGQGDFADVIKIKVLGLEPGDILD